jgi:hypothetical protein
MTHISDQPNITRFEGGSSHIFFVAKFSSVTLDEDCDVAP